jgi:hypothetical protein
MKDFIALKNILGELVLCHKQHLLGTSITTKEIFFQKPHHTYHILFEHILSITPYEEKHPQASYEISRSLYVDPINQKKLFKIAASEILLINRKGKYLQHNIDMIIPLSDTILSKLKQHSGLIMLTA